MRSRKRPWRSGNRWRGGSPSWRNGRGLRRSKRIRVEGAKELSLIYGKTGLDPDPEVRKKIRKRARRITEKAETRSAPPPRTARNPAAAAAVEPVWRAIRNCSKLQCRRNRFGKVPWQPYECNGCGGSAKPLGSVGRPCTEQLFECTAPDGSICVSGFDIRDARPAGERDHPLVDIAPPGRQDRQRRGSRVPKAKNTRGSVQGREARGTSSNGACPSGKGLTLLHRRAVARWVPRKRRVKGLQSRGRKRLREGQVQRQGEGPRSRGQRKRQRQRKERQKGGQQEVEQRRGRDGCSGEPPRGREALLEEENGCMKIQQEKIGEDTAGASLQASMAGPCPSTADVFLVPPGQREVDEYVKDFTMAKTYSWATAYVQNENLMRSTSIRAERTMRNGIFPLISSSKRNVGGVGIARFFS